MIAQIEMHNNAYMKLIKKFPLIPIRDETHLDAALELIDELLDKHSLTAQEKDYFDVLVDQVHHFEEKMYPSSKVPPLQLLKYLMQSNDLKAVDLVPLFGTKSVVSEVLNGKRQFSKTHIANLANHFSLSPAAFFPA